MDGIDGVLADCSNARTRVLGHVHHPFAAELTHTLLSLNQTGPDELHRAALAGTALAQAYAHVVTDLLHQTEMQACAVSAIGAHGQTVRHRPGEFDGIGYTLQLNNPALLAELTGIDVVADFRSRDVAAGGQGAPLVPAFHHSMFMQPGHTIGVLNLGGIANLSIVREDQVLGFDCGPGNALMDAWCMAHTGQPFDAAGQWAASGQVHAPLLQTLLAEPYFALPPPKSTGRDLFNPSWLAAHLAGFADLRPVDVQATLAELTAQACARDVQHHAPDCVRLMVCGGGALNRWLMQRLGALMPAVPVADTTQAGLPPLQVEAAAFAWLACRAVQRQTGSLQSVTGARGARVLGAVYPA